MSETSSPDSTNPPVPAKAASRWEDFIDIFYAPSSVFARRAESSWLLPALVVTVLLGVIYVANMGVMQPIMDAEFSRGAAAAMRKNPQVTPEMMDKMRGVTEKFGVFFIIIGAPISMFFVGVFLWIAGKIVGAKQKFGAALMVAAYSYVPRVVESVINGIQGLLMDPASLNGRLKLSLGAGRFLDPDGSPFLLALLGRVDVFTIWITILLGIGLSVTGKVSRTNAFIAAAIVWVLGGMFVLLGVLRNS